MNNKYKVSDLAKDFGITAKEISALPSIESLTTT